MPSFMENWLTREYNLVDEINSLNELMFGEMSDGYATTFSEIVDYEYLEWKCRNNTITRGEFERKSGIKEAFSKMNRPPKDNVDMKFVAFYLEYALNLANFVYNKASGYRFAEKSKVRAQAIIDNVKSIVEKCGLKIARHSQGVHIIVIKDAVADLASDIVGDSYNLGQDIFLYRHNSLEGNLVNKADILVRMAKYLEKEIKPNISDKANLRQLYSNVGFLSNALDLRHPPNEKEEPVIKQLVQQGKLEQWYDDLYRQIVSLIVLFDCAQKQQGIDDLKEQINPKN